MPSRSAAAPRQTAPDIPAGLAREQLLEMYYYLRLTRSLEERLTNLYRQGKVIGGLFRSLGQEADSVGSAYALAPRDFLSPLIRNLGSMLVKGAEPLAIIRQYMAKDTSPTRGRELNIHFGDLEKGFIGQISHLGDMVPVMAGVCLSFKLRGQPRVGLVYVGDGAMSTGTFHEGINLAAVQRLPMVVIAENNGWAYTTPTSKQSAVKRLVDKAPGYGIHGDAADGNDLLAVYEVTKKAVDRARAGGGVTLVELHTYRRKGHAEHDNQSYVPKEELAHWEQNDPVDRYVKQLGENGWATADELAEIDARVDAELTHAVLIAENDPFPEPETSLTEVYANPAAQPPLWYRDGPAPGSRLPSHG
ncbi:MAG: thiamine pyrophosphate-dependent dehydrogenase E1 component subunit alpha [Gemmatimonadota bacterium]|jgi:pyruvate dehydrogenase E1 component alpha subunit/2-oxoisovalerate dehydrogenase E1 component alpha subunit